MFKRVFSVILLALFAVSGTYQQGYSQCQKPPKPVIPPVIEICQYAAPPPITATGSNLLWYTSATGGVGVTAPPVPYTGYATTFDYYVTQTVNNCESDRAHVQVVINYQPNATFVPSKEFVCREDTISFIYYGNALPDATYIWDYPVPQAQVISGLGTQGPLVLRFDTVGTYVVGLTVNNRGCVSGRVNRRFEVRDRPEVHVDGKREICLNEVTQITIDSVSTSNISDYQWNFGDGDIVYGTSQYGPFGVRWYSPGKKEVIIRATSRSCGSFRVSDTFNVHAAPAAEIMNKTVNTVCAGDSLKLQARDLGAGFSYSWSPSTAFRNQERLGTTVWTTPAYSAGRYPIALKVTDSIGCVGQDTLLLKVTPCCDVYFPNAFTPNGDMRNDRFGMITSGNPVISAFRIFNRWGKVIWQTSDPMQSWDGTYEGTEQPAGMYLYHAKYRCSNGAEYESSGEINLVR